MLLIFIFFLSYSIPLVLAGLICLAIRRKTKKAIEIYISKHTPTYVTNPGTHVFKCDLKDFNKFLDKNAISKSNLPKV